MHKPTYRREGGGAIEEFETGDAESEGFAMAQTGLEAPLRTVGAYSSSSNPWPRDLVAESREEAFAIQKRKIPWKRQGQGNRWDQYGDLSSLSASAEKGGKETHMSE